MRFKPGARKTLQQSLRANLAAREFYAPPVGDPRRAAYEASIASHKAMVKPVRKPRMNGVDIDAIHRHRDPRPLEKDVLADILKTLRSDPRIGYVWRQNSGVFREGERYIRSGPKGMPDLCGVLLGGKAFFIEVKRDAKSQPEPHQAERLGQLRSIGAIAGVAWSVESALALLP